MILAPTASKTTTTKVSEMLLTIPATNSKPKQSLLALIDSRTSASLIKLQLPQFVTRRNIEKIFHLFENNKADRYDVIIGRDLQQAIGIYILNSQ